jgi:hypothetical protein
MPNWKKVIVSGSDAALNTLNVSTSLTSSGDFKIDGAFYDNNNTPGTSGQMLLSTATGIEWADNIAESAQDLIVTGKNMEAIDIPKGTPLYFSGSGVAGNVVGVYFADAGDLDKMPAGGIAGETITSGNEGDVYIYGYINGVDTSAFAAGDNVFVGVGGGYTNIKPTGSALIQKLGNVEKVHPSNGSGVIQGPSWYNDVPNITSGYTWVGNSDQVATAIATSSIQNVVSSSYAVTASHALNAGGGGTDTVVVQYGHTNGNALGDSADYFIGMGTSMGNTGNSSIQIGIQAGTLVRADIATYNASTFGSSEASTVSVFSNNFAQEDTISTSVLFNARHSLVSVTGLSINLLAGLSVIKLLTPVFTTNPASAKINITLYIEI